MLRNMGYKVVTRPDKQGGIHGYALVMGTVSYKASDLGKGRKLTELQICPKHGTHFVRQAKTKFRQRRNRGKQSRLQKHSKSRRTTTRNGKPVLFRTLSTTKEKVTNTIFLKR